MIKELDCQVVIHRVATRNAFFLSDLDNILHNILSSCISFSYIVLSPVLCDGNFVAHHLAKLVPFEANLRKPFSYGGGAIYTHGQLVFELMLDYFSPKKSTLLIVF